MLSLYFWFSCGTMGAVVPSDGSVDRWSSFFLDIPADESMAGDSRRIESRSLSSHLPRAVTSAPAQDNLRPRAAHSADRDHGPQRRRRQARRRQGGLQRFDDFTLAEYTQSKMLGGPFLLSIDWREQHTREREFLKGVIRRQTTSGGSEIGSSRVRSVDPALHRKPNRRYEMDVAGELAEGVALKIVSTYFGVTRPCQQETLRAPRRGSSCSSRRQGRGVVCSPQGHPRSDRSPGATHPDQKQPDLPPSYPAAGQTIC